MTNTTSKLTVSYRPFRRSSCTFTGMNSVRVLLLLLPLYGGIHWYGWYAIRITAASIFFSLLWDFLFGHVLGKRETVYDADAIIIGLLFAMLMPPLVPWWIIALGTATALFLGKYLFGGVGGSPFNAVCIGWVAVILSWPALTDPTYGSIGVPLPFSTAYPLSELHRVGKEINKVFPVSALFFGKQAGTIGTGATLLIIISGSIGCGLRIIPWRIPLSILIGIGSTAAVVGWSGLLYAGNPLFHMCTGFSCLGAFFIASDFSSRPISQRSTIIYGFCIGVLTVLFRLFGKNPEGFPFAVLIMNMCMPLIDKGKAPAETVRLPEVIRL